MIDLDNGAVTYTIDYINESGIRAITTTTKTINIGTGKNISRFRIGKTAGRASTNFFIYLDNVSLYTLATYADLYTNAKAEYDTKAASLDAAGQAYWTANVTAASSVTTAAAYATAVAALPTTYVAAVKAQTTGGSDMTDAGSNLDFATTDVSAWSRTAESTGNLGHMAANSATLTLDAPFLESYINTGDVAGAAGKTLAQQTITEMPNGYYKITAYTFNRRAWFGEDVADPNPIYLFIGDGQTACNSTAFTQFSAEGQITDNTLTFGITTDANFNTDWNGIAAITITFLGSTKYDYTINAVAGGATIKELATGTDLWPSETYGVFIPKVIEKDSKFYVLDDADNENLDRYYASYVMGTDNATQTINYTLDESIVGFYEGEEATGSNVTYSDGAYGTVAAQNKRDRGTNAGTLTPGIYQFEGRLVADGNSGRAITLREGANDPMASLTGNNTTKTTFVNFEITSTTGTLYINGANSGEDKTNLSTSFDYVLIRKLKLRTNI